MLTLAFKNITRTRRRTYVALLLIVSGTFLLSAMRFLTNGFTQDMVSRAVQLDSGFVEVAAYGWKENRSVARALEVNPALLNGLRVSEVRALSPRINGGALLSFADKTRFVSVLAADPAREKFITTMHRSEIKGELPGRMKGGHGAMIGHRMARSLGMKLGDTFYLVTSQLDGSVGALALRVRGIFKANDSRLDTTRVMLNLRAGEELFGTRMGEERPRTFYTSVALAVPDYLAARRVKEALQKKYPPPGPAANTRPEHSRVFAPVILDWKDLNPEVLEMVEVATVKMSIYLVFFVISISFGVLNTIQMSIQQRLRELGVLLAIGTRPSQLLRLVFYEACLLVVPGVVLGIAMAAGLAEYLHNNPIDLTGTALGDTYASMGIMPRYRPIVQLSESVMTGAALIVPALLMSLLAARRLFRLNPIQVINVG